MDDQISCLDASIDDFFLRAGLTARDRLDCYAFIDNLYPDEHVEPSLSQGYCSLTVFVGDDLVIQFRPPVYKLDLEITKAAREVYGTFAPDTNYLGTLPSSGLLAYNMTRVGGMPFKDFPFSSTSDKLRTDYRRRLCKDFAAFVAKSFYNSGTTSLPLGMVGSSLVARLKALVTDLPLRFQYSARNVLRQLHEVEALPWVLTHGDIIAANIMIDPTTCQLLGFVDWAEAERLPFGVCFYGLEEILGEMTPSGFCYHPDSEDLRSCFWEELKTQIPELQQSRTLEAVKLARDLGVLLWHGIAFDNGAINRVVEDGRDVEEIKRLDAFLCVEQTQGLGNKLSTPPLQIPITPSLRVFPPTSERQRISAQ